MVDFFKSLAKRYRTIEKHNGHLIKILANIEEMIKNKKRRGRLSLSKMRIQESPQDKIYSVYKPPLKEIEEVSDDEDKRRQASRKRRSDEVFRDPSGHITKGVKQTFN
jgi:hypothetical protein